MLKKSIYAGLLVVSSLAIPAVFPQDADAQIFVGGRRWGVSVGGYPSYYGGYYNNGYYGYPAYYGGGYYGGYRPYYNSYYAPRYYGGYRYWR